MSELQGFIRRHAPGTRESKITRLRRVLAFKIKELAGLGAQFGMPELTDVKVIIRDPNDDRLAEIIMRTDEEE